MAAPKSRARALFIAAALLIAPCAFADGPGAVGPNVAAPPVHATPQTATPPAPVGHSGQFSLLDGAINLNVPATYRFYSADEAYAYLQRNHAAAPTGTVLGMLAPASENIMASDAWASIVSYQDIGYVPSNTANGLAAPNFEADVRAARVTQARPFEGFATPPAFDLPGTNVAWGERVAAPGAGGKDLRYEQKLLGRKGVACLTSIGAADQMNAIMAAAPDMMHMIGFTPGNQYSDYVAGTDTLSNYTVPALVTGVPPAPQALASTATTVDNTTTSFGGLAGYFPWIVLGVVLLAGAGYLATRRRHDPNLTPDE